MNLQNCRIVGSIDSLEDLEKASLFANAQWLEVRADQIEDVTTPKLCRKGDHKYIYSLRTPEGGGSLKGGLEYRKARLCHASYSYDLVELDFETDLDPDILNTIPPEKRLISWHGKETNYEALRRLYGRMRCTPAAYYKLVPQADALEDGIDPLYLLRSAGRDDVIIYCSGHAGSWTRILAAYLGSPFVYGHVSADRKPTERGALNVDQLFEHYGFPEVRPVNILFGQAGREAMESHEPRLHNNGYRELQLPALFLPFYKTDRDLKWFEPFAKKVNDMLGFDLRGMSLSNPFKEVAIAQIGERRSSRNAWLAKGASVMVRKTGKWYADAAEAESLVEAVAHHGVDLQTRKAAVLGCGGAGRAAAVALSRQGAQVTLYNRSRIRGQWASSLLNMPYEPLSEFDASKYDLLVNATPLGVHDEELPFDVTTFDGVIIDYAEKLNGDTPLVAQARLRGIEVIDGHEILEASVGHQFRLMTGRPFPCYAPHEEVQAQASVPEEQSLEHAETA